MFYFYTGLLFLNCSLVHNAIETVLPKGSFTFTILLRFLVRFLSSDGCERVDELQMFR